MNEGVWKFYPFTYKLLIDHFYILQHLTTTTRIYLVFTFSLKFVNPAED